MEKKKKEHYVDNKKLYSVMSEFKKEMYENEQSGIDEKPIITEYLGECFLKIAKGLAQSPNFINYTYKEEMISDGVENCIQYCHNFNPEKSTNPFSYFTQIIYFAFLRRIEREKKQSYIRHKLTEKLGNMTDLATLQDHDSGISLEAVQVYMNENSTIVADFEEKMQNRRLKNKRKSSLEKFMETE